VPLHRLLVRPRGRTEQANHVGADPRSPARDTAR